MRYLLASIVLAGCTSNASFDNSDAGLPSFDARTTPGMRLVQANVGNMDLSCDAYTYKLCKVNVEQAIRASIANLHPDVVALQEVTTDDQCAAIGETDPSYVCAPSNRVTPSQARRLVGPDFTIACDGRDHYECVAVRVGWGGIENCPDGELCIGTAATTAPPDPGCDAGFSISAYTIQPVLGEPFTLIDAHPPSGFAVGCRKSQLEKIFEGPAPLAGTGRALITGDFNLDPYTSDDVSAVYFRSHVGPGTQMQLHSGIAEHAPPFKTSFTLITRDTFDHVASTFAEGTCLTLGEAPGTSRLDRGSGCDHRGLLCDLSW